MQVHIHPSSFVVGQPITPVSWPRKLPRRSHISVHVSSHSILYVLRPLTVSADFSPAYLCRLDMHRILHLLITPFTVPHLAILVHKLPPIPTFLALRV